MLELLQVTQLDRLVKKSLNRNILVVRLVFARVCYNILTHRIVCRFFFPFDLSVQECTRMNKKERENKNVACLLVQSAVFTYT